MSALLRPHQGQPLRMATAVIAVFALAFVTVGCAHLPFRHRPKPVTAPSVGPGEARAEPAPAPRDSAAEADSVRNLRPLGLPATPRASRPPKEGGEGRETGPETVNPPTPVESVMSPEDRKRSLERAVTDTTDAGQALRKCAGRTLLPDQESVFDAVRSLLAQARTALQSGELWRAESLARKARQLASSLNCP